MSKFFTIVVLAALLSGIVGCMIETVSPSVSDRHLIPGIGFVVGLAVAGIQQGFRIPRALMLFLSSLSLVGVVALSLPWSAELLGLSPLSALPRACGYLLSTSLLFAAFLDLCCDLDVSIQSRAT